MYKCNHCGEIFEYPAGKDYCYEEYCGVSSLFGDRHYGTYECCPVCESEDFDPYHPDDEEEEEWED